MSSLASLYMCYRQADLARAGSDARGAVSRRAYNVIYNFNYVIYNLKLKTVKTYCTVLFYFLLYSDFIGQPILYTLHFFDQSKKIKQNLVIITKSIKIRNFTLIIL